jgi:fumarate hydratase class I
MDCRLDSPRSLQQVVDEGVRRAYLHPDNKLRASILADPAFSRVNTKDNTPSVLNVEMVPGDKVHIDVAAKGGGSENKSKFKMMNPSDSIVDWVLEMVPQMGAGWCPPGMLGIGIGGTAEKAMLLAKQSLMDPIDMTELLARGPSNPTEELRIELYEKVNALGIGAQGLGGLATVLDIKIKDWPTHAASKPVAMIPNCAATRHAHVTLDGSGPAYLEKPVLADYPQIDWAPDSAAKRVDLDTLTPEVVASWKQGDRILLNGKMLTGRDAAHKRIADMLAKGEELPVEFKGRVIYYVGPVDPVGEEIVGPAGPTTATRMDKFMDMMLEQGLLACVGKAERGPADRREIEQRDRRELVTRRVNVILDEDLQAHAGMPEHAHDHQRQRGGGNDARSPFAHGRVIVARQQSEADREEQHGHQIADGGEALLQPVMRAFMRGTEPAHLADGRAFGTVAVESGSAHVQS